MEDFVWASLQQRFGTRRNEPATWTVIQPTGLQDLRPAPVFEPIGSALTLESIDDLLGAGQWKQPKDWGQFLISFPSGKNTWGVPSAVWHTDFDYLAPRSRLFGLIVFSFLRDTPAHSGSTVVVAGAHRLIQQFVGTRSPKTLAKMKKTRQAFLQSDPWLRALSSQDMGSGRRRRIVESGSTVNGVDVRVVELTGKAGDVILGHPWLLHATAVNCGNQPRMMRVARIRREEFPRDSQPMVAP